MQKPLQAAFSLGRVLAWSSELHFNKSHRKFAPPCCLVCRVMISVGPQSDWLIQGSHRHSFTPANRRWALAWSTGVELFFLFAYSGAVPAALFPSLC